MLYLVLSILSSAMIGILFKLSERFNVGVFHMVVLNYFAAAGLGFALNDSQVGLGSALEQPWIWMALVIGVLFIVMFFVIGTATRQVGVSVTTIAAKMSVVVPMVFSILRYGELLRWMKSFGIVMAVVAVVLTVLKKNHLKLEAKLIYFPIILFFGAGLVDSLVKMAQEEFVDEGSSSIFSGVLFLFAATAGIVASFAKKENAMSFLQPQTLLFGLGLGVVNFGSLFFTIHALESKVFDSSIVFGMINIGVVLSTVAVALIFFRERLTWINWIGVALAVLSLGVLSQV